MFEKEAEDYALVSLPDGYTKIDHQKKVDFQKGAEFGYKEGIKTLDDMTRAFNREHKKYTDLRIANEWHKVADEGLPINKNDGATYLLYTIYGEGGSPVVAHFAYKDKQDLMNVWTGAILTEDKIVYWKEIVLPELKESE